MASNPAVMEIDGGDDEFKYLDGPSNFTYPVAPFHSALLFEHRYMLMFIKLILRQVRELVLASAHRDPDEYLPRILEAAFIAANNMRRPVTAYVFRFLWLRALNNMDVYDILVWAVVFDSPDHQLSLNERIVHEIEWLGLRVRRQGLRWC